MSLELDDLNIPTMTDEEALTLRPTEEEAQFLESLGGQAANDGQTEAANDDALALQGATGTALMVLNMVEGVTKNAVHPQFGWQDTEKQAAAEQIAPALIKNGGQLPEWLEPYKEEVIALFAIGSLAFGGYLQVKELRQLEQAKAKAAQTAQNDDVLGGDTVAA